MVAVFALFRSCSSGDSSGVASDGGQVITAYAADGLELRAVSKLFKESNTVQEFEEKLNNPSAGINNLDLNEDGTVDYIHALEYTEGSAKGVALFTIIPPSDTQEVANLVVENQNGSGRLHVQGNQAIYGHQSYYASQFSLTDALIIGYLMSNHNNYRSPYGYDRYPDSYSRNWPTRSDDDYRNTARQKTDPSMTAGSSSQQWKSPVSAKNSEKIKAPLREPTSTQRAFQSRNPSKKIATGGFGRSTSNSSVRGSLRSGSRSGGGK